MFFYPVYARGGMTLAALRHKNGDRDFFALLRAWGTSTGTATRPLRSAPGWSTASAAYLLPHFFHVWLWTKATPKHL